MNAFAEAVLDRAEHTLARDEWFLKMFDAKKYTSSRHAAESGARGRSLSGLLES
jgi:hypothetical protein